MEPNNMQVQNISENSEVDFRLKDIASGIGTALYNQTCKAIIGLLDLTGTKVTIEHGDHTLNMMYTVVDNSKPYKDFYRGKKHVEASFKIGYDKIPGKRSHYSSKKYK